MIASVIATINSRAPGTTVDEDEEWRGLLAPKEVECMLRVLAIVDVKEHGHDVTPKVIADIKCITAVKVGSPPCLSPPQTSARRVRSLHSVFCSCPSDSPRHLPPAPRCLLRARLWCRLAHQHLPRQSTPHFPSPLTPHRLSSPTSQASSTLCTSSSRYTPSSSPSPHLTLPQY